jgi:hypothetical protein
MSKNFLFVDANGVYEEGTSFETSDFIDSSVGAADAGKPIVLDSNGLIDSSMISLSGLDHGTLSGLGDDDHTQYSLVNGTRDYSAVVSYASHPTFNADTQLVDKKYVDDVAATLEWQDSVLTAGTLDPTSLSPSAGDRYLINGTGAGAWAGQDNNIAEWSGSAWVYTSPTTGMRVGADDEPNTAFYLYGGSSWEAKYVESTTASTGLEKVGYDIRLASSSAGDGLGFTAGVLNVNVDDSSIEIDTDTLQVKALGITNDMLAGSIADGKLAEDYIKTSEIDDISIEFNGGTLNVKALGIKDTMIDFGTGINQVSAADLPISDAGSYTDETDVEGSLQELYQLIDQRGVEYTSGGVSKGDLCFISANDTASTYSTITTFHKAIGLASATVGASSPVKVLANDTIVTGILSSATAGDVYYWDGSTHVNSIPSGSGSYVIQTGVAKNATDLAVECRLVKKNI